MGFKSVETTYRIVSVIAQVATHTHPRPTSKIGCSSSKQVANAEKGTVLEISHGEVSLTHRPGFAPTLLGVEQSSFDSSPFRECAMARTFTVTEQKSID